MRTDPRTLRTCLGRFATGVTVVTCEGDSAAHGATVNSFTAVSLEPPLVLVSLDRNTKACKYLDGKPFTINVLREPQQDLALHFAGKPMAEEPEWEHPGGDLAPRLAGALATIACAPWRSYDGGDHVLYLGEIREIDFDDGDPLVFYAGKFRHLGKAVGTVPWLESGDCPSLSWFPAG
ncbi:flavin reductase family protein [Prauserella flavalba]|uniref:flavin reductase family protein n=1 Tax=Prauserella flavalba TaxID=1477506 RepID=UPI0036E6B68B